MEGQVLGWNSDRGEGMILGTDKVRYPFYQSDWRAERAPMRGLGVDFEPMAVSDNAVVATEIWLAVSEADDSSEPMVVSGIGSDTDVRTKRRRVAGWLAIVLGMFGAHKFYLGHVRIGLAYILAFSLFAVLSTILFPQNPDGTSPEGDWTPVIPFILLIMGIIEGIIILTRSNEDFHRIYVVGRKKWF